MYSFGYVQYGYAYCYNFSHTIHLHILQYRVSRFQGLRILRFRVLWFRVAPEYVRVVVTSGKFPGMEINLRRISQNPVENSFSQQRNGQGGNNNPDPQQVASNVLG